MENKHLAIIGALLIIIIFIGGLILFGLNQQPSETLRINDLNLQQDEFGIFNLVGHITPLKDFSYLEAKVVLYDSHDTIIGSGYAWNMNNLKKGDNISLSNGLGAVSKETPAYAVVSFYDTPGGDKPVANFTIRFTADNSTNATADANEQTSSNNVQQSQSSSDDNKKYNQNDLELARLEGYNDGYHKAYDTIDEYNQGDSGSDSSSNVETTDDSSSSSSDTSSSSESANVEITTG